MSNTYYYPRLHSLGLIEARYLTRRVRSADQIIRGFTASASLKPRSLETTPPACWYYPRLHSLGLIEAEPPIPYPLPREIIRGFTASASLKPPDHIVADAEIAALSEASQPRPH